MKLALTFLMMIASTTALAGNGGTLVCSSDSGRTLAVYNYFHSVADSYSTATVLIFNNETEKYEQFEGGNEEALSAVLVETPQGRLAVKPNRKLDDCKILVSKSK